MKERVNQRVLKIPKYLIINRYPLSCLYLLETFVSGLTEAFREPETNVFFGKRNLRAML